MKHKLIALALNTLPLLAYGCIPIALPAPSARDPEPFVVSEIEFIKPGETHIHEVTEQLGEPILTREGGKLHIYGRVQRLGIQAVGLLLPVPLPTGHDLAEEAHLLFVLADENGLVENFEVHHGEKGCLSNGICVARASGVVNDNENRVFGIKTISDKSLVIYKKPDSTPTSATTIGVDHCRVQVYQRDEFIDHDLFFYIDESPYGITTTTYVATSVAQGNHRIKVDVLSFPAKASRDKDANTMSKLIEREFDCPGGETIIFELDSDHKLKVGLALEARKVSLEQGLRELRQRHPAITR